MKNHAHRVVGLSIFFISRENPQKAIIMRTTQKHIKHKPVHNIYTPHTHTHTHFSFLFFFSRLARELLL